MILYFLFIDGPGEGKGVPVRTGNWWAWRRPRGVSKTWDHGIKEIANYK